MEACLTCIVGLPIVEFDHPERVNTDDVDSVVVPKERSLGVADTPEVLPLTLLFAIEAKLALVIAADPLRLELVKPDIVFDPAAIVLLVKVSVVARPTMVSLEVGRVRVPELIIDENEGAELKVLEPAKVCVPVVTTPGNDALAG